VTSAILAGRMKMRYAISAIVSMLLLFFSSSGGFSAEIKGSNQAQCDYPAASVGADNEGELPDNPLLGDASESDATAPDGRQEAGFLSNKEPLADKVREALEALQDSLRRGAEGSDFEIPLVLNEAVARYIRCFTGPKRDVFTRWLWRSERYAPTIKSILKKNGLPEDLVYLSMIESGFNMKACSRAQASGPWQFINETGRRYGLKVDYWVDERYDLEKSTVAAARYLKTLFERFGSWYLVAASYNAGENRVERAIEKKETRDFWKLRECKTLPKETQEYVPQLIAAALIAKEPEEYGFTGAESAPVYRLTRIAVPGGIPLKNIAHALSLDLADLRALNPEILKGITPPDRKEYLIKLPGTPELDGVSRKLEADLKNGKQVVGLTRVCVTKKDPITRILKRYDVSRSDLALVNGQDSRNRRSRVVYVPHFAAVKTDTDTTQPETNPATLAGVQNDLTPEERLSGPSPDRDEVITLKGPGKGRHSHAVRIGLASQTMKKRVRGGGMKARKAHAFHHRHRRSA
jgi:hypothetical protein